MDKFKLVSPFRPAGDQPAAIEGILKALRAGERNQTLLGVTGSGKTFTVASVIAELNRPALIISPNKVLAAQLYSEFKTFFPENSVEYFISYYDYYQPEAYLPQTDTYIEKDASINEHIDKLRLKATASILNDRATIVVASVSCIYNIGSPENFSGSCLYLKPGAPASRAELTSKLVGIYYERNEVEFSRGKFRVRGGLIDVFPADTEVFYRVRFSDKIEKITAMDPLTQDPVREEREVSIYPAKHFISDGEQIEKAVSSIRKEMEERCLFLEKNGKNLFAERLKQRTLYDLEMLKQAGYCHGIENYSRHLSGRPPGSRPMSLMDYFPEDYLLFIDESHVTAPQIRGMYEGDRSRKQTLIDFGFRLPSALDNRPLKFAEFEKIRPQTVFVSATPGPYEMSICGKNITEQIIRPTGLVDPETEIYPLKNQIGRLIEEIGARVAKKERTLVLTLTKKTAEDLSAFFREKKIKASYIHSSMDTMERLDTLDKFREGEFDVLVGINLLREGLDIPEVSLVAILNADNEGYLRSETTLVQISGRAARNKCGKVILFADRLTGSMKNALREMERRRGIQLAHNKKHGIKPQTIKKALIRYEELRKRKDSKTVDFYESVVRSVNPKNLERTLEELGKQMEYAADNLNFELAAELRDRIYEIREMKIGKKIEIKKLRD